MEKISFIGAVLICIPITSQKLYPNVKIKTFFLKYRCANALFLVTY